MTPLICLGLVLWPPLAVQAQTAVEPITPPSHMKKHPWLSRYLAAAAASATGLSDADYDLLVQGNYSLYVKGTLTKTGGQSCKPTAPTDCVARESVTFTWGLKVGTSFDDCASETGEAGFSVPTGGTVQVKPTIHGDHWFFTNITQGAEVTERKAQWISDSDLNRDGDTTLDELKQVQASDVFTQAKGYNLSAPG